MFTLEDDVTPEVRRVEIKLGEMSLTILMRPVTDDERIKDTALHLKFSIEDDPEKSAAFFAARDALKKSVVIGWEGIQTPDKKPIPFTAKNFQRLLKSREVRSLVVDAVNDHFNNRIADAALGESRGPLLGSLPGDSNELSDSRQSSTSTVDGSQQDGSQQS